MVQSKENDPNILYEQFRKRRATEFYGAEDVMKDDRWLEHIKDVFSTIVCTQKQRVLREVAKMW